MDAIAWQTKARRALGGKGTGNAWGEVIVHGPLWRPSGLDAALHFLRSPAWIFPGKGTREPFGNNNCLMGPAMALGSASAVKA